MAGERSKRGTLRWLRPAVDAAMTVVYLLQMVPGKVGNPLHEAAGLAFVALFVLHHALNRGWLRRLGRQHGLRARVTMASDMALTACVVGAVATGVLMSRSVAPWAAMPAVAHVVRPLHGCCAYLGLMLVSLHLGLHLRVMRGYAGLAGRAAGLSAVGRALTAAAVVLGAWAFARLGVGGKLLGQPSFPDAMTPMAVQLAWHLALAAPFVAAGALVDDVSRRKGANSSARHE